MSNFDAISSNVNQNNIDQNKNAEHLSSTTQHDETITKQHDRMIISKNKEEHSTSRRITRQSSVPNLNQMQQVSEQQELRRKSGEIWQCISRTQDKYGGYIYEFITKDEYDWLRLGENNRRDPLLDISNEQAKKKFEKKLDDIFPATENSVILGALLIDNEEVKADFEERYSQFSGSFKIEDKQKTFLHDLGYSGQMIKGKYHLKMPDRDALLARLEKLKETQPEISVEIASTEDVAGDLEFIEALFLNDAVLSSGKEFVHDSLVHVIPTILLSTHKNTTDYQLNKAKLMKFFKTMYQKIYVAIKAMEAGKLSLEETQLLNKNKDIIRAALAAYMDVFSALTSTKHLSRYRERLEDYPFLSIVQEDYRPYFEKKYGKLDIEELEKTLQIIDKVSSGF